MMDTASSRLLILNFPYPLVYLIKKWALCIDFHDKWHFLIINLLKCLRFSVTAHYIMPILHSRMHNITEFIYIYTQCVPPAFSSHYCERLKNKEATYFMISKGTVTPRKAHKNLPSHWLFKEQLQYFLLLHNRFWLFWHFSVFLNLFKQEPWGGSTK